MKKILVAVTGSTPQILTETIYALYKERNWIPDEVHVLTTTHGRDEIQTKLFDEGHFSQLCTSYDLQCINFTPESIHVITNKEGLLLSDIKSVEDNDRAANMIVHFIHDLCQDPNNELHVSLAGGRKSMGFYIGYALSLFGRQQDSMSHVLVSHPYEYARDFFYPTKNSQMMTAIYRDGDVKHEEHVDAKEAKIWLSDIPFVRMGEEGLPNLNFSKDWAYRDAVELAQRSISDFTVVVDVTKREIICDDRVKIKLSNQEIAFYAAIAKATKEGFRVSSSFDAFSNAYTTEEFAKQYIDYYGLTGKDPEEVTVDELKAWNEKKGEIEIFCRLFPAKSRIDKKIAKKLGDFAGHFGIQGLGDNTEKYYQLSIKPENITII